MESGNGSSRSGDAPRRTGRRIWRVIRYGLYLSLSVFLLLEIALRIYNPFHLRLKGDKIILPIDQRQIITNRINPKLDPVIVNTRNSLGFRGPEPPPGNRWDSTLTLITIGGSTTECHFLSDSLTWPWLLGERLKDSFHGCWLNNAGLDGHSTYGHLVLLNDHVKKLRPLVVLFLVGQNDVETASPSFHDRLNTRGAYPDLKHWLFNNSEVLNLGLNLVRGWRAQRFNNTTNTMLKLKKGEKRIIPDAVAAKRLAAQEPYLEGFRGRLSSLVDTCIAHDILPVLITQPCQFGPGTDPVTGVDLERYPLPNDDSLNGGLMWKILEEYNGVTRSVCRKKNLPLIDLAYEMPKNSLYFYDMSHFTNAGAAKIASLIASGLIPILEKRLPRFRR